MKTIDCEVKVLPNGHLLLPPEVAERIKVKPDTSETRRIIIFDREAKSNCLSRYCGKWQDDRDADDIIAEIMEGRRTNNRSDQMDVLK
ncbi:MAG: hypothetical protein GY940_39345 [bacterium]|nr:hypothetical protein [bacterium]